MNGRCQALRRGQPLRRDQPPRPGRPPGRERGFALVPALFLLVVLGALALVAIRVGTGQQHAVTMSLMQARALAAARSGIERGANQALPPNNSCPASTTLNLTEAALNGFTVVVTCTATPYANGAATNNSYVINATATYGSYGQPGYVRRVVSTTFTDAS
jgi:MSHA biogenesis protein MshP